MKNQNICLVANPVNILNNSCSSREKNVLLQLLYSINIFEKYILQNIYSALF